ncbi:MAG: DUF3727 domain-containing protein [Microcoleaceae cyanobacterium]
MSFSSQPSQENGEQPEASITITDEKGQSLKCVVQSTLELDQQEYLLLVCVDQPVVILTWPDGETNEDEAAIPVESDSELDAVFPIAKAVLAEQNLTLHYSTISLTVSGELPELSEEDLESMTSDEIDGEAEEYEELVWLASFYYKEQEYGVYIPLDPFLILARVDEQGQPQLLSPEELQQIEPLLPMIEDQLFEDMA